MEPAPTSTLPTRQTGPILTTACPANQVIRPRPQSLSCAVMPAAHRGTRLQGPRNIPVPPTVLAVSFGQLSLGVLGAAASAL